MAHKKPRSMEKMSTTRVNRKSWASEASEEEDELLERCLEHQKKTKGHHRVVPQEERPSIKEVPKKNDEDRVNGPVKEITCRALEALKRRGTDERLKSMESGYSYADFCCPAFINEKGKRESIPYALSTNKGLIINRLKETMKGLPESAEISFKYTFARTEEGKLKDEEGNVRVTVNW